MNTLLKHYFPMLRTRADILEEIRSSKQLSQTFDAWKPDQQEDFLELCTGVKGDHLLSEMFLKAIAGSVNSTELLRLLMIKFSEETKNPHRISPPASSKDIPELLAQLKENPSIHRPWTDGQRQIAAILIQLCRNGSIPENYLLEMFAVLLIIDIPTIKQVCETIKEHPDDKSTDFLKILESYSLL